MALFLQFVTIRSGSGCTLTLTWTNGIITASTLNDTGYYSVQPSNPVSTTGGTGTGATFTLTFTTDGETDDEDSDAESKEVITPQENKTPENIPKQESMLEF